MRDYPFQPARVVIAALVFTAIVIWQSDLGRAWWVPAFVLIVVVFAGMHAFYNWANTRLNEMGRRAREVEDNL